MVKRHTTENNFDNSLNFGFKKNAFVMQNTGNFNNFLIFYIATFEASLKYIILKYCFIKTLLHKQSLQMLKI